ncbi:hypothetical protein CRENBAI_020684 [Crenichthys baileyi]|uniref:Uncharacterized protein n=1 Tax=Crenichthys baileyi TaxID=28760 RepID=A0AAV9RZP9_9TELE
MRNEGVSPPNSFGAGIGSGGGGNGSGGVELRSSGQIKCEAPNPSSDGTKRKRYAYISDAKLASQAERTEKSGGFAGWHLEEGGGQDSELGKLLVEDVWVDDVQGQGEVHKQDPGVHPWVFKVLQDEVQSQVDRIIC